MSAVLVIGNAVLPTAQFHQCLEVYREHGKRSISLTTCRSSVFLDGRPFTVESIVGEFLQHGLAVGGGETALRNRTNGRGTQLLPSTLGQARHQTLRKHCGGVGGIQPGEVR